MKRLWLLAATLAALPAAGAYKCVDERGLTHIGDTPPPGCANVMMYEITPKGTVIRSIAPTLTAEQAKARQAELEKKKDTDKAAAEQKRKDMALLSTYSTEKEFDVARDRNVGPLQGKIKNANDRIVAIDKRTKDIEDEMEFYKAGKGKTKGKDDGSKTKEVPSNLTSERDRLAAEKASLQGSIAQAEKDIAEMQQKFDVDKKRWIALKGGKPAEAPAKDAAAKAESAKPAEVAAKEAAKPTDVATKPADKSTTKKN